MSYFKAKMHRIQFRLGFRPDPREGRGGEDKGGEGMDHKGGQGKGPEGKGEGGKRNGEGVGRIGEGEGGEGEWTSPTHYFRLKSCTVSRTRGANHWLSHPPPTPHHFSVTPVYAAPPRPQHGTNFGGGSWSHDEAWEAWLSE